MLRVHCIQHSIPLAKEIAVSDRVSFDPWSLSAGEAVLAMTAADHSRLLFDPDSDSYTRIYPNGKQIHFNANGTHS